LFSFFVYSQLEGEGDVETTLQGSGLNLDSLILTLPGDKTPLIELSTGKSGDKPLSRVLAAEDR